MPLVTRSEVENLARSTAIARTRAKDFASCEPTDENERLGRRDIEVLTVHLLFGKFDELVDPFDDRMVGSDDPEPLFLPIGAPLQVTGRSHQSAKNFREVRRMEDDQPHPIEHSPLDTLDNAVRDLVVVHMAPPDEDIRAGKDFFTKAMFWFVKRGGPHYKAGVHLEHLGQLRMDSFRIDTRDSLLLSLLTVLISNEDIDRRPHIDPFPTRAEIRLSDAHAVSTLKQRESQEEPLFFTRGGRRAGHDRLNRGVDDSWQGEEL